MRDAGCGLRPRAWWGGCGSTLFVARIGRVELGLDLPLEARRTDAVAESRVGVLRDVLLDALPVVLVVAYALAVRADREDGAQRPHFGERGLQLAHELLAFLLRPLALRDVARDGIDDASIGVGGSAP